MTIVTDPDLLNQSTIAASGIPDGEVFINPTTSPPTIELISTTDGATPFAASSIIAADGVSLQALYSFLKEEWKTDTTLIKYPFPMEAITSEQFEFINDWELNDTTTASRTYIRFGGWAEKDAAAAVKQEYLSCITLGSFVDEALHTAYYSWAGDVVKTDFTYPGPVNEAVKIFGDATHGNIDNRSTVLTLRIRPATIGAGAGDATGYTYNQSTTTDIGSSIVTYQAYRFPLTSVVDLGITLIDTEVDSLITSKTFDIEWFGTAVTSSTYLTQTDLNGGPYNFSVVIDNATNNATPDDVYNFIQYKLRDVLDIDSGAGTEFGVLTDELVTFVGSVLETFDIDSTSNVLGGVLIGSVDQNELSNFAMRDNDFGTNPLRVFPSVATGNMVFNTNLIEDAAAKYWMFFDNAGGNTYPGTNATIVNDNGSSPISGDLHGIVATPSTGNATGTSDGDGTAAAFTMTNGLSTWTIDDFADKVLVVTSGLNAGHYWIVSNTASTLTLLTAFEATDAAMNWEIRNKSNGSISWTFDYTNNVQGGRTGNTAADVSIVAVGLETGQYVLASGNTIGSGSGQNFSITASLERNYSDPT